MLVKKIDPNPKVTTILKETIVKTKNTWANLKPKNSTYEEFKSQALPEQDVTNPNTDYIRINSILNGSIRNTTKQLETAKSILGADEITNSVVYNPMSFMKWHTNSNNCGKRIYYTFSNKPSVFMWKHPKTNEIILEKDNAGWSAREFIVDHNYLLWHSIWAEGLRFSYGFNKKL